MVEKKEEQEETKEKEDRYIAVNVPETFLPAIQDNVKGTISKDVFEVLAQILNELHLLRKNIG